MVRCAEIRLARHDAEAERRRNRLAEPGAEEQEEPADPGADSDSDFGRRRPRQ